MKELSIEEKAKAYDEALERAREWSETKNGYYMPKELCEEIFPEFVKSEDERIRKAIICGMNALKDQKKETFAAIPIDNCIAWLEKQGKKKPTWSEEDEHWRQKAIDFVKHPDLIKATPTLARDTIDWLKFLRPQKQ